jgi:alpha-N-arabinofuranosidase
VTNNIMLSKTSLLMNSSGATFAHNIFGGAMDVIAYDSRLTPYHPPHSTQVAALHDNPGGDIRFINNLFVNEGNARQYDRALLPVILSGNVYTKGTNLPLDEDYYKRFVNLNDSLKAKLQKKQEKNALEKPDFDAGAKLVQAPDGTYLEINLDKSWITERKRDLVTSALLGRVIIPDLPFENPDGTKVSVATDYFGKPRNAENPAPGPFEDWKTGKQSIRVWPKK